MGKLRDLPWEILLDILSRLPTETVLECKLVCKPWKNLVRHRSFSQMQLAHLNHHRQGKLTFLTVAQEDHQGHQQFYYLECNDSNEPMHSSIRRVNLTPRYNRIIGSIDGLICLGDSHDYRPACIYNPITKEYVMLPKINDRVVTHSGFGYLRETNEYKIVIMARLLKENHYCVKVYTLGSGNGWRNVGEYTSNSDVGYFVGFGVFANGALHWITEKVKILGFNLFDEKFYETPTMLAYPSPAGYMYLKYTIGALRGFLWCSIKPSSFTRKIDIWLLKKNRNQNKMELGEYLTGGLDLDEMKPLALMESGEVLLFSSTRLSSYDRTSSCFKTLINFPKDVIATVPHINTFISLEALGEVDTKTMEYGRKG